MISVTLITQVELNHRALRVAVAESGHIVAVSKMGAGTLIEPDHETVTPIDLECHVKGVAISPRGHLAPVLEEDALSLIELPDLIEIQRLDGAFEGCRFSRSGSLLWTTTNVGSEAAAIEVRETKHWRVVAKAEVQDPFGDSALMLFDHPDEHRVVLWVAGGQDGQCLYWVRHDGSKLSVDPFLGITDIAPPWFNRVRDRFLAVSDGMIRLYQFPNGPELGSIEWPLEDDPPGEVLAFTDDEHALVHSGNGRLFILDLRRMRIADEVEIQGHEPRPARELFPNLPHDLQLSTDLGTFFPLPSSCFLSIHQVLPSKSLADWRDRIVTWQIPHI